MGDKESASSWREFFKDLKSRGLKGSDIKFGVMDGLSGLERFFKEEFINSKIQRCLVHGMRNVLFREKSLSAWHLSTPLPYEITDKNFSAILGEFEKLGFMG